MEKVQTVLYKDVKPIETITRIRNIFYKIGVLINEDRWYKNGDSLYSVRISFNDSFIGSNGKGMSKEAALASAYAELMERIQNQFNTANHNSFILNYKTLHKISDFIYSPDEIFLTPRQFVKSVDKNLLRNFAPCDRQKGDAEKWLDFFSYEGKLLCIPFADVISGKIVFLPLEMIRYHYGSTGMCAGNNIYEALVQGMSEVSERHCMDVIYHKQLTPPELNKSCISRSPHLKIMIEEIEKNSNFHISIKDCSLNMALPVVAVIAHDKRKGSYHVNFGSHPNIDEAISRAITETFQGRHILDYKSGTKVNLKDLLFEQKINNGGWSNNFFNLLKTNDGAYPNSFFFGKPSYNSTLSANTNNKFNNKLHYQRMCNILHRATKGPIFIRDVSFLGFPSYQVIVPGTNSRRASWKELELHKEKIEKNNLFIDLDKRKIDEFKEIKELVNNSVYKTPYKINNILPFTWLPLRKWDSQWSRINPVLLLSFLHLVTGSYKKAIYELQKFINILSSGNIKNNEEEITYFSAIRDYLVLKKLKNYNTKMAKEKLEIFYSQQLVEKIIKNIEYNFFSGLKLPRCFRCNECELREECDFETWSHLHSALREKMAAVKISQEKMLNQLSEKT
ncbi:MAG: YcaO-like family protein [bacterium]|nr:YcaO-like family protein [bacterium]